MKNFFPKISQSHKGFTLMEIMVAVSIFTIVMVTGISSLLIINTTNIRSRAERQAVDEVSFLLESMSRKIRTAAYVNPNISGSTIDFINQFGETERYDFEAGTQTLNYHVTSTDGTTQDYVLASSQGGTSPFQITGLTFDLLGNIAGDGQQNLVVIRMVGTSREGREIVPFAYETAVSPRILETN